MADPTMKQGGWYNGQQYWNGQLGPKGVVTNPGESGFGKPVSKEVNAQSDKAQGNAPGTIDKYLTASTSTNVPGGANAPGSGAQSVLDNYQAGATGALSKIATDASKSDAEILAEVRSQLKPTTSQPTAPNLVQTYQGFLATSGVTDLNKQLGGLNSQIATIQSSLEAQKTAEEAKGGTVPLSVIAGRQTEEQRLAQVQLDSLSLQKGVLVDQINSQMTSINTLMQFTQQDYQNASDSWQKEFDVNAKIYDAFTTQVNQRNTLALEVQKAAATNFQTMANLITSGNISYNSLTPEAQLNITKMETQAGLPVGMMASLQMSPKDRILKYTQYRGQVQALILGEDGQMHLQTYGSGGGIGTGTPAEQKQQRSEQALQDAQDGVTLETMMSIYKGELTPTQIYDTYNQANYNDNGTNVGYGAPKQSAATLRSWGVTSIPYSATQN